MLFLLSLPLLIGTALLLIPLGTVTLECLIAVVGRTLNPGSSSSVKSSTDRPRVAVLIPAHNEQSGLGETLKTIRPQLLPNDRIVVVSDNCTDNTAQIAREHGAQVVERTHATLRGKGYALEAGRQSLLADPPEVVIFVDADCTVHPGTVAELAVTAHRHQRPIQACYELQQPANPTPRDRISAFAFRVKNLVRPYGLHSLGLPCLLTGSGMALPWSLLYDRSLASGDLAEDLELGLDLTIDGTPPLYCPEARVTGILPDTAQVASTQRSRWERGHIKNLMSQAPRLIKAFLRRPSLNTLAVLLELCVPPLTLLVGLTGVSLGVLALCHWATPLYSPIQSLLAGAILFGLSLLLAWFVFARDLLSLKDLAGLPHYALSKLPVYKSLFSRKETGWVRTAREGETPITALPEVSQSTPSTLSTSAETPSGEPTRTSNASSDDSAASNSHASTPRLTMQEFHRSTPSDRPSQVRIGRALIDNVTMQEAVEWINRAVRNRASTTVVTPNVDHIVKLESHTGLLQAYDRAGLVIADGMPLIWASKLLGTPLKQKVSGSDLFPEVCKHAAAVGQSLFLMGGRPEAADITAQKLRQQYPTLQIDTYCPPFGFDKDPVQNAETIRRIREAAPDILFVGLGAPKQELWMDRHAAECGVPVSLGVGGTFEFQAGIVKRAPVFAQKIGLEWLWRLASEPRRMFRRYLIEDPYFLIVLWRQWRGR